MRVGEPEQKGGTEVTTWGLWGQQLLRPGQAGGMADWGAGEMAGGAGMLQAQVTPSPCFRHHSKGLLRWAGGAFGWLVGWLSLSFKLVAS